MKNLKLNILAAAALIASPLTMVSCQIGPNAQVGTVAGGLGGGAIGYAVNHSAGGVAVGAIAGGLLGNAIGGSYDRY